jgi:hypothetical protein
MTTNQQLLDELKALRAELDEVKSSKKNDDFIPIFRQRNGVAGCIIDKDDLPEGDKFWINIFPNRYFNGKKKVKKGERPQFHYTVNAYTPKEK